MKQASKAKAHPGPSTREKVYITYPRHLLTEPLIYRVGHKFKVVTSIGGATISNDVGLVAVEFEGTRGEIDRAIAWLREQGVQVEPIEKNVIE